MSTMLAPALLTWFQFGEPTPDHNESCGQNATASCLVAGGHLAASVQAPLAVDQWMRSQGWQGLATGGTNTWQLAAAIQKFCPCGPADHGNNFDAIVSTLDAGRYAIVLVGSDSQGHPVPNQQASTGHWVAVYGWDGSNYHIANSGSGRTETYSTAYFRSAYRGATLDTGIVPKETQGGGPLTQDEGRSVAYSLLALGLDEGPSTPAVVPQIEAYATAIAGNPEGGISTLITDMRKDPRYVWTRLKALEAKAGITSVT